MRRSLFLLSTIAFLAFGASKSLAQTPPPVSTGGLIAPRNPDDGVSAPRALLQPQVLPIQRWLISWALAMQQRPVVRAAAAKARPVALGRSHAGTP